MKSALLPSVNSHLTAWKRLQSIVALLVLGVSHAGLVNSCFAAPEGSPSPTPHAILNYVSNRLVADPVRPRVYATVPSTNSVIAIDTNTLTVIKSIWVGSEPYGLAISADRSTLWVTNTGSTNFAVRAIDLDLLRALPATATPLAPYDIEEGVNRRLYITPLPSYQNPPGMMQIDGDTGAYQRSFLGGNSSFYGHGYLEVSPDRKTLYFGAWGSSAVSLEKFNIASSTPVMLQRATNVGGNGHNPSVNHTGDLMVYPNGTGNYNAGMNYATTAIPTANLVTFTGVFKIGPYPGPAAFSNDDTLLYHSGHAIPANRITVFDTCSYTALTTFEIGGENGPADLVVDRSGQWLFVSTSGFPDLGDIRVFSTGRSDPLKPLPRSVVSRKSHATAGSFDINLPLRCGSTTECRMEANGAHHLVFTFSVPVNVAGASLTPDSGKTAELDGPMLTNAEKTEVTVNLRNVSDAQRLTVTLLGVTDGSLIGDLPITFDVLAGDINGDGTVNAGDVLQVRNRSGQTASEPGFRADINGDGTVNSGDSFIVRSHSGNTTTR